MNMGYQTIPFQTLENLSWVLFQAGILEQIPAWDYVEIFPCATGPVMHLSIVTTTPPPLCWSKGGDLNTWQFKCSTLVVQIKTGSVQMPFPRLQNSLV